MFSQYYVMSSLQGLNNTDPYQVYLRELSQAQNISQLNIAFQKLLVKLDVESEDYKENKKALNKAYTKIHSSMLKAEWNKEYLTSFRLCLVSVEKLFDAFKSTEGLIRSVDIDKLMTSLQGLHYNEQVSADMLNHPDRPATIKKAIHFYSIPQSFIRYYDQKMLSHTGCEDEYLVQQYEYAYQMQQKDCYRDFDELAQNELSIFCDRFNKNVSNYLFYLLVKNVPDSIMLLHSASISREDLIELRDRIRCPSTMCVNKLEICQVAEKMIADMPESIKNNNDAKEVLVTTIFKNCKK